MRYRLTANIARLQHLEAEMQPEAKVNLHTCLLDGSRDKAASVEALSQLATSMDFLSRRLPAHMQPMSPYAGTQVP